MAVSERQLVRVGSLEELKQNGQLVVSAGGHSLVVFWHEDRAWAVDNRCPHMGFPLSRGTVCDGLLTCHWHHARFDLASGGTLDPFADDVRAFPVVIRDGEVLRRHQPRGRRPRRSLARPAAAGPGATTCRWCWPRRRWRCSRAAPSPREIVRVGARYGARYRARGWGQGMTILTAMANMLPALRSRRPAAGALPRPDRRRSTTAPASRPASTWSRCRPRACRLRATQALVPPVRRGPRRRRRRADPAARPSRGGAPPRAVADMLFAATTDHYYIDAGHTLDFVNKAFELLDHLGWERGAGHPAQPGRTASAGPSAARSRRPGATRWT